MLQLEKLPHLLLAMRQNFGNIISIHLKQKQPCPTVLTVFIFTENGLTWVSLNCGTYMINNTY